MQGIAVPALRHTPLDAATGIPPQVATDNRSGGPNETAWRTFRKRLLGELETNEWSNAKPPEVVEGVVDMAHLALAASGCTVFLSNSHGYRVFPDGGRGKGGGRIAEIHCDSLSAPAEWVMQHASPVMLNDVDDWSTLSTDQDCRCDNPDARVRILCVPVTAAGARHRRNRSDTSTGGTAIQRARPGDGSGHRRHGGHVVREQQAARVD